MSDMNSLGSRNDLETRKMLDELEQVADMGHGPALYAPQSQSAPVLDAASANLVAALGKTLGKFMSGGEPVVHGPGHSFSAKGMGSAAQGQESQREL